MADDKTKRLRTHVVKELFDTEKDYTDHLEFTVTVLLEKARVKGQHDNTFTDTTLQKLFCNIEDILGLHRRLLGELKTCVKGGVSYSSHIAGVYLKFREEFLIYQEYGKGNEAAQKLLYELQDNQAFNAFFLACLLLGGRDGGNGISSYLFKPIQRVTKYPLLFRELEKYTPLDHPDYEATKEMGIKMREICFVINEAKRGIEKLDHITDWQATVDGWEGSKVTDTCNEMIKEGALIKISAGNTQERMFFLFDNLLVYCKKSLLSRTRPLLFRGRLPMENLDVEDIEDGTADFHTSGITVTNSWKVHNIAKDKWFVLIARTPEEKKQWMDAIRSEKEKRKRSQASTGQAIYRLMVDKGEKLYQKAKQGKISLIHDHKVMLRSVSKCFSGAEFASWLVDQGEVGKEDEAVILAQHLLENGIIHHINDKHQFKKGELLYRFRYDDGTFRPKYASSELSARSVRMYCRLHGLFDPIIKDQKGGVIGGTLKSVLNAQKLIEWLLEEKDIVSRDEGVALGRQFVALGVLRHATDGQDFRDTNSFYRFTADDVLDSTIRRGSQQGRADFVAKQIQSCITLTVPYCNDEGGYGVVFKDEHPLPVSIKSSSSHAKWCGVREGQTVVAINGYYLTSVFGRTHLNLQGLVSSTDVKDPPPLHITVLLNNSDFVKLCPAANGGLGFHIRGSSPVIIHGIDKGSAAADVGLLAGSCILGVGGNDVVKATHEEVVAAIKTSLEETKKTEEGASVKLKVSCSKKEQLVQYEYETGEHTHIQVYERTLESPYTFTLPAKLLKLLALEAKSVVSDLEQSGVSTSHVTTYITGLKNMVKSYEKTHRLLQGPRYPSYKPFGPIHSATIEACPFNLHTSVMEVISPSSHPPPSPSSASSDGEDSLSSPVVGVDTTSYFISTMASPSVPDLLSRPQINSMEQCIKRYDLMQELKSHVVSLKTAQEVLNGFVKELGVMDPTVNGESPPISDSEGLLAVPMTTQAADNTPSSSPTISRRARNSTFSDPLPSISLELEGLGREVRDLIDTLESKLLIDVMTEVTELVNNKNPIALLQEFKKTLKHCLEQAQSASTRPGHKLTMAVHALIETATTYTQEVLLFISLSLTSCNDPTLLQKYDKLFSQCLVALATGFSHQLVAAARGQFNSEPEYGASNEDMSSGWLQLVANKGVVFHVESLLSEGHEVKLLQCLEFVTRQLKSVLLHVVAMDNTLDMKNSYPEVTVSGGRSAINLTFALPSHLFNSLPATLTTSRGVKVHPVLLNKGLVDIPHKSEAYSLEKAVNKASLETVRNYYRKLRSFRLGKSLHRQTSEEKAIAISETAQPLHVLELLTHQVEVAIREPTRPGIGLLPAAAELCTRMGALRVCVCDSGVFRSGMTASLEQVMILVRSHQLPMKSVRLALDTLRKKGTLTNLISKNGADKSKSLPRITPQLYRLPNDM